MMNKYILGTIIVILFIFGISSLKQNQDSVSGLAQVTSAISESEIQKVSGRRRAARPTPYRGIRRRGDRYLPKRSVSSSASFYFLFAHLWSVQGVGRRRLAHPAPLAAGGAGIPRRENPRDLRVTN